ncbi:GGDEF domain-containing protein [Jeongeupia naejangsanensis]|uniref:GGDEF domain-containing protein n=1 Tax=Jeongeupia naejangsanensis TaxID=613195 RepID=A0ABS2BKM0_9NEIS|nr:GGDEF domain-containing protein [Jeongeupia naejangsanensis]MBM3116167.1 GGDEF domain-containing protein [Jeongeupia naejangsanensis]
MSDGRDILRGDLDQIIAQGRLNALFQPIASMRDGEAFGYEGLVRGPSTSFLHSPINLFRVAEECGLLAQLDFACRRTIVAAFVRERLPGKLFLNVCPATLIHPDFRPGATLEILRDVGLSPQRVVIELTETQPTHDYDLLKEALLHYREMGFRIAIDDLGEGFSGLRLWSELKPEYVKIDKYFIQGLTQDAQKRQFVRSIHHIALNTGTRVVAEGIETPEELDVVRRIGISLAQGYLIGRPQPNPPQRLALEFDGVERPQLGSGRQGSAGDLLVDVPKVSPDEPAKAIYRRFADDATLYALPVVDGMRPVGLLKRHEVLELFARPFTPELFGNRPCSVLMDRSPLIVEASTSLQELSQLVTAAERRYLADGFIVTSQTHYLGMGTGHDLMRAMTELQVRAARHANPLTLLPGNVPIQERIERWLAERLPFTVAYFDLDHFKPYNDVYGYARGDALIQLCGETLLACADPVRDFVGHIGGDDFVVLFRSDDAQLRCQSALMQFEQALPRHFSAEHMAAGGYSAADRRGMMQRFPLVSLSAGLVDVVARDFASHHEVAAAAASAKSLAKRDPGSTLFVERRSGPHAPSWSVAA